MEKMPFRPEFKSLVLPGGPSPLVRSHRSLARETDWRRRLPVLAGPHVTLRELRPDDATSLLAMVSSEEVARFISPPPTTVEGFERFIEWTASESTVSTCVSASSREECQPRLGCSRFARSIWPLTLASGAS